MKHEGENYNRIYDVKLVMNYNNGRLGVAREVSDIPDRVVGNDDNIYVFCKKVWLLYELSKTWRWINGHNLGVSKVY